MQHSEFEIGKDFWCNTMRWRCTDIGRRTITAICIDSHETVDKLSRPNRRLNGSPACAGNWFEGPPYAVREHVFDEDTLVDCLMAPDEPIIVHLKGREIDTKIELPALVVAGIWSGARRGEIGNVEEYVEAYVRRILDRAVGKIDSSSNPESVPQSASPIL